jgi:hypothetical protein
MLAPPQNQFLVRGPHGLDFYGELPEALEAAEHYASVTGGVASVYGWLNSVRVRTTAKMDEPRSVEWAKGVAEENLTTADAEESQR